MIAIVKYNAGNVRSVENALKRLGETAIVTNDPEKLKAADKVIFPGVGEASSAMKFLKENRLDSLIRELKQPFLGICLGMQLMCSQSEEGDTDCLGIFPEKVKRFRGSEKVPHMGWNGIENLKGDLFRGIPNQSDVYFVHSYFVETGADTIATTLYGIKFAAAIQKNNFYAVQFHPEKSSAVGASIIKNFLAL